MIINAITELVGNTPLLLIPESLHGLAHVELYAKLELFNPWGSVKDRSAMQMLAPHRKELQNGKEVIESSSGNAAKALQLIAGIDGSSLLAITNRIKVKEQADILRLVGATIEELPGKSDCYDPNDPADPALIINNRIQAAQGKYVYTDQYVNENNLKAHYEGTGKEIAEELGYVDYVIGGLGTTGSTRGIAERLRTVNPKLQAIGVVAESDDYIPGIRTRDEVMEVGLFGPSYYASIITVDSKVAVYRSLQLIRSAGLLAGPTTGAALAGAVEYLKDIKPSNEKIKAVFVACDRAEPYISYYRERKPEIFGGQSMKSWSEDLQIKLEVEVDTTAMQNLAHQKDVLIVDLRSAVSYKLSHIPGSLNIPFRQLDTQLQDGIPFSKDQTIILVCAVGEKSKLVASYLEQKGVRAHSLRGGLVSWRQDNGELQRLQHESV